LTLVNSVTKAKTSLVSETFSVVLPLAVSRLILAHVERGLALASPDKGVTELEYVFNLSLREQARVVNRMFPALVSLLVAATELVTVLALVSPPLGKLLPKLYSLSLFCYILCHYLL